MLKIVGIILIIAATTKIGFSLAARLERRKNALISFKDALSLLESEISFSKNTLPAAFLNLSKTLSAPVSDFFRLAHDKIVLEGLDTQQAWEEATEKYAGKMCLAAGDIQVLRAFAARLGKSDVENELKNIYNTTVSLNMQIASAKNVCDTNKRVYQSAGVLCGALIAILLM